MNKFQMNPILYRRYFCIVLVSFYILINSVHINALIPVLTADETKQFAERSTKFAIDLLRAVTEDKPSKNVVFSSFSIQICLGVIQLGAYNKTFTDLQRLLPSYSVFRKVLVIYKETNILNPVSHSIYNSGSSVLPSFKNPVEQYFRSANSEYDFHYGSLLTMRFPWWFERKEIPRTRTTFTLNSGPKRRLVFGNLMNFKNEWRNKFSKAHTHLEDFYMGTEERSQVPMMTQVGLFLYARIPNLKASALILHFRDCDMSMLILLPDPDSDIYQLQKAVTYNALKKIRSLGCYQEVQVKLPKFNVTGDVYYTEALKKMGLGRIFSMNMHIFEQADILRVHRMVQKSYFILSEEGINQEDRATQMDYEIPLNSRTRVFHAHRPFIFFLENEAGHTFYAGKVDKFD